MSVAAADEALRAAATDSVTFAFGDPRAERYGLARVGVAQGADGERRGSALAVVFAGRAPVAAIARGDLPVPADAAWQRLSLGGVETAVQAPLERWTVGFDDGSGHGFALEFTAMGGAAELGEEEPAARLGGMAGYDQPCRVRGTVRTGGREQAIDALGQRGRAWGDADWQRIELARTVSAWTDATCASVAAVRPSGARHHAEEATWAALWEPGGVLAIEPGRLSTTYDAEGHPRRAGMELWPAGEAEDAWPRRAAGEVLCGSSLDLGALRLDCAFFRWHVEGRPGVGRYDIVRRSG